MPVNVAQLVVSVGANTAMAEQGIMGLARLLGRGGPLSVGAIGAGVAIAGVFAASVKMAGDFQTQLTQLVTGAGEAQSNLKLVSDGVLQMARDTGTSTKQLTNGLYMIESAGFHGQAGLDILTAAAKGAKVGAADLGTVADAVTTVMKDYGDTGITAAQATNTLVATVANGKTHMQDLAGALANVLPSAQAAGVGLNDVMAAMAAQTAAGVPAADAATHLRQLLIALEAPSSAARKALQGVGLTTDQVATMMKTNLPGALQLIEQHAAAVYGKGSPQYVEALKNISGGMREMQGMLLLTSDSGMKSFESALTNISGQVKQGGDKINGWNLVQGTFNQQMSRLGEIFQTLMIQLGTNFLPVLTQVAQGLADLMSGTGGASGMMQQWQGILKQVSDAFTPLEPQILAFAQGMGKDALNAGGQLFTFFRTVALPALLQFGQFFVTTILPVIRTFSAVLVEKVLPALLPVVKTIAEKWLPPLEKLGRETLPVLTPLLQIIGLLFQNVIGPALNQSAQAIGAFLDGIANTVDAIEKFVHNPNITSMVGIMKSLANLNSGVINALGGQFFGQRLPHFAEGGVMADTGLALVGEAGPELVSLPGGAQVTPLASLGNASLPAGSGYGGGGPQTINITLTNTLDGRVIGQQVVKIMPNLVRTGTGNRGF
ncbi:MAG TPA: phage tail tape measure protein [Ktedonobacterales bacterium]|nr:phage tail tape measure protein [Ktedonobacterales bacterium]